MSGTERPARIELMDALRGLAVCLMVLHHFLYDLCAFLGAPWWLFTNPVFDVLHYFFAGLFIFLSGISSDFSRSNLKRGAKAMALALGITLVTYFMDMTIVFGVLHLLASCMLLFGLTRGFWEALPAWVLPVLCLALIFLTAPCADGVTTQTPHLWLFGFTTPGFASADYFPCCRGSSCSCSAPGQGAMSRRAACRSGFTQPERLTSPSSGVTRLSFTFCISPRSMRSPCCSGSFLSDRRSAMYYGEIKNCDIANGEGVRVTLFVSGCTNRCKNCFQPQTWAFDYGQPFTAETEEALLQMLAPAYINGLTLLGGEPFEPENQRALLPFLRRVRERLPVKTVWAFTGFTWEQLHTDGSHPRCEVTDELLSLVDVLVDGRFVEELHDISLRFRGSSNQRIIDVPRTLSSGGITLWEDQ